jgi:transcriptional regulator with XRE-family HTH domain
MSLKTKCFSEIIGSGSAQRMISEIIKRARQRGLDQSELAERAGISAEALSRLKRSGRCRLGTFLALAFVAGMRRLDLVEELPGAASIAATKLSVGRRVSLTADELVKELARGGTGEHEAHMYGFFEELPIETVHDVILDERLDCAQLVAFARRLGAEGETVEWLEEMAGDGMAGTA